MASPEIHGPHYALGFNKCFFHPPRSFGHLFFFFFFFPFVLSPCHSLFLWAFFSLSPSSVGAPCCWGFLGLPFTFGDQTITCVLQQVRIYNKGKKKWLKWSETNLRWWNWWRDENLNITSNQKSSFLLAWPTFFSKQLRKDLVVGI